MAPARSKETARDRLALRGWPLWARFAAVLVPPVLVAVALGGLRVSGSIDRAALLAEARDLAAVSRATLDLVERLEDERDQGAGALPRGRADRSLQDGYAATDRAVGQFEAATARVSGAAFSAQLTTVRSRLADRGPLRQRAFTASFPAAATIFAYAEMVLSLIQIGNGVLLSRGAAVEARSAGLYDLVAAVEAASQQRALVISVLVRDRSTLDDRDGLVVAGFVARTALAAFQAAADRDAQNAFQRSDAGSAVRRVDEFVRALLGTAGSYAAAGLSGADWQNLSNQQLGRLRDVVRVQAGGVEDAIGTVGRNAWRDVAVNVTVVGLILAFAVLLAVAVARAIVRDLRWLAAAQARERATMNTMLRRLSGRTQDLVASQLTLITELERPQTDPDQLDALFRLDHLATRVRRHEENLLVLAGGSPGRRWTRPESLYDVVRAATAEADQYARIEVLDMPGSTVASDVVVDVVHLLAELLDNATGFSGAEAEVQVVGRRFAGGRIQVEVRDNGPGMDAGTLAGLNARLVAGAPLDLADGPKLGLFVVGLLAARHGIRVRLGRAAGGGTTATVILPAATVGSAKAVTLEMPSRTLASS